MRILFVASELAPLAQTGGLGEAVAGLADALSDRGHEVVCSLPAHRDLLLHPDCPERRPGPAVLLPAPGGDFAASWQDAKLASGPALWLLDAPRLFGASGVYGSESWEPLRWASLCRATALRALTWSPDVLVAHDWPAAIAITMLRSLFDSGPARTIGTVQVVHNNAYQGRFPAEAMWQLSLPGELFRPDGLEFHGDLCLLKGGLLWSDRIVTVSPRYARELTQPDFGEGLDGVYRLRQHRLAGIVNGIDTTRYDPSRDPALPCPFDAARPEGRRRCRDELLGELRLETPPPGRLLGAIGRFADQKGWDLLAQAVDALVEGGASIALVGDGETGIAATLRRAERRHPGRVRVQVGWNEALARRVYGGVDAMLVPSRFEPCGLVQLLAQRYGALPIAHRVGGLVDTIQDGETGVLFGPLSVDTLVAAVERGAKLLSERGPETLSRLLRAKVSWEAPAERWESLLEDVAAQARARL